MVSLDRRRLPAVLQRTTSGWLRRLSRIGSATARASPSKWREAYCRRNCDALQNIGLGFLAEPVQPGDLPVPAGLLQLFQGFHAELVVDRFYFFWAQAGNGQHGDQSRRDGGFEFFVIGELPVFTSSEIFSCRLSPMPLMRSVDSGEKIFSKGTVEFCSARRRIS